MRNGVRVMLRSTRSVALVSTTVCSLVASSSELQAMGCTIQPPVVVARCPPLKEYTPAESIAIGNARSALRAREPGNLILDVLDDAFALRQACRALMSAGGR